MIYAGIGAKNAPADIQYKMNEIAKWLGSQGFTLRVGGVDLDDFNFLSPGAFVDGCFAVKGKYELFPSQGAVIHEGWLELAGRFHGSWETCSMAAKMIHATASPLILGAAGTDPASFVICYGRKAWSAQPIRIAEAWKIPIFDLAEDGFDANLWVFLQQKGVNS